MATLNYSRSQENTLQVFEDRKFDAVLDIAKSDGSNVAYGSTTILLQIYTKRGGTLVQTLTSGTEITVTEPSATTSKFTFNVTFTDLAKRRYYYVLFDSVNYIGISHGPFIAL